MKQPLKICLLWAFGLAHSANFASASEERAVIEEEQGKALLIYNIAKFSVWPAEANPAESPFEFTLWDDKALEEAIKILEGMKVHGRDVGINRHKTNSIPVDGEVIIISANRLSAFTKAKDELGKMPILTVTTNPEVFEAGAMVLVEVVDDYLSFSVNLERVKASGLEISGNLLRHAKEVNF